MKVHAYALLELRRLTQAGLGFRRIAAALGLPEAVVHELQRMKVRDNLLYETVVVARNHPGGVRCVGCGGMLAAVPCVKCASDGDHPPYRLARKRHEAADVGGIREYPSKLGGVLS